MKDIFKRIQAKIALCLALCLIITPLTGLTVKAQAAEELTGLTAMEITSMMGKGWNLGNTFDANGGNQKDIYSQEQSWGNPKVNQDLINGVAAAGFKSIRIPTTWYKHVSNDGTYTIAPEWLARIKEVVDMCYANGLFIILNMHHEAWLNTANLAENQDQIGEEFAAIWRQITDYFADYDQHLIFEAMNEPRAAGTGYEWTGTQKEYDVINRFNQIFVDIVRDNGKGHNPERALMVPDYAASSNASVLSKLILPQRDGKTADNIIVAVHSYDPYEFCLTDNKTTFDPKKSSDTSGITSLMKNLKTSFIDKGIPVVLGECGCTNSKNNNDSRLAWFDFFGRKAAEAGIPALVWDNGHKGTTGGECHYYFNRRTGEVYAPDLIDAFINGYVPEAAPATSKTISFEPYKKDDSTVLVTPLSVGFLPTNLGNQAGVNHTPDASGMGFALKVASNVPDMTVTMRLNDYKDTKLVICAYVYSDTEDTITAGLIDGSELELAKVTTNGSWTKLAYECEVKSEDTSLYIKGQEGTVFYIDDVSILIDDGSLDKASLLAADIPTDATGTESSAETSAVPDAEISDSASASAPTETVTAPAPADSADTPAEEGSSRSTVVIVISIVGALLVIVAAATLAKKRKK